MVNFCLITLFLLKPLDFNSFLAYEINIFLTLELLPNISYLDVYAYYHGVTIPLHTMSDLAHLPLDFWVE